MRNLFEPGKTSLGARDDDFRSFPSFTWPRARETGDDGASKVSLDSKCGSNDPDSPETPALEPGHPFEGVVAEATAITLEEFLSMSRKRPSRPQRPQKRPRLGWSDTYVDFELASDSEDLDTAVTHHSGSRTRSFACPFYLKDRVRHKLCLTRHSLLTIDDVKEHICTTHRRPNFCPICKDTFATMRARDDHIRRRSCQHRESPTVDGLTDGQIQQIERQGSSSSPRESHWYALWDVVSPLGPPPLSPYYSTEQEVQVVALRSFYQANGRTIISDLLRDKGLQGYSIPNEERSLAVLYKIVLHDAIDKVYSMFAEGSQEPQGR